MPANPSATAASRTSPNSFVTFSDVLDADFFVSGVAAGEGTSPTPRLAVDTGPSGCSGPVKVGSGRGELVRWVRVGFGVGDGVRPFVGEAFGEGVALLD